MTSVNSLAWATAYLKRSIVPLPVPLGSKEPIIKAWPNWRPGESDLPLHFGSGPTNVGVLLGPPSNDLVDVDLDDSYARQAAKLFLPATGMISGRASSPESHFFYRSVIRTHKFKDPDAMVGEQASLIEIRAGGCQTLVPPSVHPCGDRYEWFAKGEPAEVDEKELYRLVGRVAALALLARRSRVGIRHEMSLALSGVLLRRGWAVAEVEHLILLLAKVTGDEEYDDRRRGVLTTKQRLESDQTASGLPSLSDLLPEKSFQKLVTWLELKKDNPSYYLPSENGSQWQPRNGFAGGDQNTVGNLSRPAELPTLDAIQGRTESTNASRLVAAYGAKFRYVVDWEKFISWTSTHWEIGGPTIEGFARQSAEALWTEMAEAARQVDARTVAQMAVFIKGSVGAAGIRNVLFLTRSEPGIAIDNGMMDQRPTLFNCLNGTIDLERGTLRPHDPNDLLTLCAPVVFDPAAQCPLWIKFLAEVFDGDGDLIDYLQRAIGYSLTGLIREAVLFFLYGMGRNGKTVLVHVIQKLLGDYATSLRSEMLMLQRGQEHPTELSDLYGRRFAAACETEQGRRLAETRIKALTGGDRLKARRMRENFWEFEPSHKLWMTGNHKPRVAGSDPAIWERIHLIEFKQQFLADDPRTDPALRDRLESELSGILNWAVFGCLEWQRGGLCPPEGVKSATRKYREEEDTLGVFIAECCELGNDLEQTTTALHTAFKEWGGTMSVRELAQALNERGILAVQGTGGPSKNRMVRKGIALLQ